MLSDVKTMVWKEAREYRLSQRGRAGWLGMVIPLLMFGIFLPWQMGPLWADGLVTLGLLSWFSIMPGIMLSADSIAGERERHTLETLLASRLDNRTILLGKAILPIFYAVLFTVLMLLVGLAVVNVKARMGLLPGRDSQHLVLYRAEVFWGAPLLSVVVGGLSTFIGVLVSLRAPTVKKAQQTLSLGFTLIWLIPIFGGQLLPRPWRNAVFDFFKQMNLPQVILIITLILLSVNCLLFALALARFQRHKLILD